MQYHLNGFRTGSPHVAAPLDEVHSESLPQTTDVLIVGCGPAGLTLAAQLSAFPEIHTCIIDQKAGPLEIGQADGIACRSVEMFEAFGFAERVLREAYWVNETTFWKPDETDTNKIIRSDRIQDTEDGLSEFPHLILSQARIHDFYLEVMRNAPSRLAPHYNRVFESLQADQPGSYPNKVTLTRTDTGATETIAARYVVGCDGARSKVRQSLGISLEGDAANQAWGVMDVLVDSDFPDIRFKCVVQSANGGSAVIIPREGGYLVRIYVELDKLASDERVASKNITRDDLIAVAQRILQPYSFDVKHVAWWSVYEIGQRLCDKFDNVENPGNQDPTVFIAGDAGHTHSPKAGQGMNVSMADAFNLGWKLAGVLNGTHKPSLLRTYSSERQGIAKELIEFDRSFARMISAKPRTEDDQGVDTVDPKTLQNTFQKHGRFTAGTSVHYQPSMVCTETAHQNLARGFTIGMRFHSAPVIRVADAKPVELAHMFKADGRWRLVAFAGASANGKDIDALCGFLGEDLLSPMKKYTPANADIDAVIDLRAVYQQEHRSIDIRNLHPLLTPKKGRFGLMDHEKVFAPDHKSGNDIFDMRKIDRESGAMIIVRPDQYVAGILPVDAFNQLIEFFDGVLRAR